MSATRKQIATSAGVVVDVGFGTGTISMMVRSDQSNAATGNLETVPDENGDDAVYGVSNLGERLVANGSLLANQTAPKKGDVVTINSVNYIVEDASVQRTALVARLSLTLSRNNANAVSAT